MGRIRVIEGDITEEAGRCLEGQTGLEEIRFLLRGEPAYRVFEQVDDARRIRAQIGEAPPMSLWRARL